MKRIVSNKLLFLVLAGIIFIGFQGMVYSQNTSDGYLVSGKVNDAQGKKAVGAVILIKGTTTGTVTDTTGFFSIKVPSKEAVLVISHFSTTKRMEVPLDGSPKIVVRLAADSERPTFAKTSEKEVFDKVEDRPSPSVGQHEWNMYMAKNAKYPQNDRSAGVEGTVIVGFTVYEDGTLNDIEVLRGIGEGCDQEVARLIAEGPTWHPGKINGQAVKTRMSLPVRFVLAGELGTSSPIQGTEKVIAEQYGKHLVVVGYQPRASLR